MKAIILAAGEGKRLYPLTKDKPKCLVELFGKSLLQWQLEIFRSLNVTDISIVKGYRGEMINFPNITYFTNSKFKTTNMVETLFCAKEKLNDRVIISYGDIIFEKKVLQQLIECNENLAVVIDKNWKKLWKTRFNNPSEDAESLIIDENGYIQNIGQKTKNIDEIQGQYIGLTKFQNEGIRNIIDFYEKAKNLSFQGKNLLNSTVSFEQSYMTDLLQGLINNNCKIMSVPINGGWLEVDSINDYNLYKKKYEEKTISELVNLEY